MDSTYGEFEGTELDAGAELEYDEGDDDLLPILSLSALVALVVGAILVIIGRRRNPTPQERVEEFLGEAGKAGKKGARQVARAVEEADLRGLLNEALGRAGSAAGAVAARAEDAKLRDLLDDAIGKARNAADNLDLAGVAGDVGKRARKVARDADLGAMLDDALQSVRGAAERLDVEGMARGAGKRAKTFASSVREADVDTKRFEGLMETLKERLANLDEVLEKARSAAKDAHVADAVSDVRKRAADVVTSARAGNVDTRGLESAFDTLKEKLADAVEAVRKDIAPKAVDTVRGDVLPAVQGAVQRVRGEVIPSTQERVGKLAEEYEVVPRARKAASAAREGALSVGDILRSLAMVIVERLMRDVLPEVRKVGGRAMRAAREDVLPTAAQTAGDVAQRVRGDVLPKVGEVAAQTPDVLSDLLRVARDKAETALDKAQPVASDALTFGRHRAADAAGVGKRAAGGVASGVRGAGGGVGGALSGAGRGVSGAVGGAVSATTSATRELTGIVFWLSVLGGLILIAFVPDRERQKEIWNGTLQFLGELREMWNDLQGVEYEPGDSSLGYAVDATDYEGRDSANETAI